MEEWKVERRKKHCSSCNRDFASEEVHYSGIAEVEGRFCRRDLCVPCWDAKGAELFSFWKTRMPKREERRLEDIHAMVEFFKRLVVAPSEDPMRVKVTYLISLILMRKKRLKLTGIRDGRLLLEKAWDGDTVAVVEPVIGDAELESLKGEMLKLFEMELTAEVRESAAPPAEAAV
jgi:hypothetical protein